MKGYRWTYMEEVDMRKQSFLKVTLLIIVALIFSVMTGCGNPLSREESLMYDSEDITLTAFVQQSASSESGLWRGWAADKLYEDTHIKIEFLAIGDGGSQKLKQYLSSGDLPDLIGFKGTDQAQLAMDTGALLPLDEYKELLPNIFENDFYQHAISYTETYISNDSGHLFMMPVSIGPASRGFLTGCQWFSGTCTKKLVSLTWILWKICWIWLRLCRMKNRQLKMVKKSMDFPCSQNGMKKL